MKYVKRFEPIESDPRILTELMHRLSVQESFWFDDILDYEEELQQPALALIVIFPESQNDEQEKAAVEERRAHIINNNVTFLKQTIDNSCGLVAVLHCVLNTIAADSIRHNSILYNAILSSKGITKFLEESEELELEYRLAVDSGETEIPEDVQYHYVALVGGQDHNLYELDGERSSSLIKGSSSNIGYILHESKQMAEIIGSFARGGMDCSFYKLTQRTG